MCRLFKIALILLTNGCVGIHEGQIATQIDQNGKSVDDKSDVTEAGLTVSGSEAELLSSKYFGALYITFENTTPDWKRISKIDIEFDSVTLNEHVQIPTSVELQAWALAARRMKQIRDHNADQVLASIAALGGIASITSNNSIVKGTGQAAAIGAAGALSIDSIKNKIEEISSPGMFPSDHLLHGSFIIPPGLHAKRWITFFTNKPNQIPYICSLTLKYQFSGGGGETIKLEFRQPGKNRSDWQADHKDNSSTSVLGRR